MAIEGMNNNIPKTYTAKPGDRLRNIYMREFGLTADQATAKIRELRDAGQNPNKILIGQEIKNPLQQADKYVPSTPAAVIDESSSFLDIAANMGKSIISGIVSSNIAMQIFLAN